MKTMEIKHLLQRYFDGVTTVKEEKKLETYFKSGKVADEFKAYIGFFTGISELTKTVNENTIEEDIMDFIRDNDPALKPKRLWLWQTLSGIAASVLLIIGGYLFFQQEEQYYADSFNNPDVAYAYAEQTLSYVSAKYNQGLAALASFDKLQTAAEPLQKSVKPINEYLELIEQLGSNRSINQ